MAPVHDFTVGERSAEFAGAVVAIGVFDGVHRGHRALIESAVEDARAASAPCVILTFDVDPDDVLASDMHMKIMSDAQRMSELAELPVDQVMVMRFSRELAALDPDAFLDRVFGDDLPVSVHVGEDFRFGRAAAGDVETLRAWGARHGVAVDACGLVFVDGSPVKSTRIRHLLSEGNVAEARFLMGHPYTIVGDVQHGRGEGADMGIATANLLVPDNERVLADGVYAAYALIDGARYKAAVSVGIPPTFEDRSVDNVEVHVLDFSGDLYGRRIAVEFIEHLRPMVKFDSEKDLIDTITNDIARVREDL